jgi:hypothetical protein
MKKKIRKFQEGGFSAEQEEWLGGADRTDPYILARMRRAVPDKKPMASTMGDDSPAGKSGYGEENELPATTGVTKTPAKTTKPVSKPTGPSKEEIDAERKRMEDIGKKQGLVPVRPEEYLIGGGGGAALKALQIAGKKLASKIAGNRGLKEYVVPKLPAPSSSTPALPAPTPKLPYDKTGALAKKRADRAEARDIDMKRSNAENYGIDPDAPGSYSALQSLRRNIGDGEFSMRKGGRVKTKTYKSGGSVSSASKRADGIATKGKTRGKMC